VHRWDLRYTGREPMNEYVVPYTHEEGYKLVQCLAIEPRHKTLLCGGSGDIDRWELETGASSIECISV
jgi:hypothetical protein